MKSFGKVTILMALLSVVSAMPLTAQITNGVGFTTSFSFYAGNAKMPAGSYKITQSGLEDDILQIESTNGKYSAFVEVIPTHSEQPHAQTDVNFHKYGNTDYLNRVWVGGQRYGLKVDPTKAEKVAAASVSPEEHSIVAENR